MMTADQNMHSDIATCATAPNPVGFDDVLLEAVRRRHQQGRVCKIVKPPVMKDFSTLRDAIEGNMK